MYDITDYEEWKEQLYEEHTKYFQENQEELLHVLNTMQIEKCDDGYIYKFESGELSPNGWSVSIEEWSSKPPLEYISNLPVTYPMHLYPEDGLPGLWNIEKAQFYEDILRYNERVEVESMIAKGEATPQLPEEILDDETYSFISDNLIDINNMALTLREEMESGTR